MNINIGESMNQYLKEAQAGLDSSEKNFSVKVNDNIEGLHNRIQALQSSAETIALSYNTTYSRCELYSNQGGGNVCTDHFHIDPEEYVELCKEFNIDDTSKYNYSGYIETEAGDLMRVFATTRPVTKYPNITLNISRKPKGIIDQPQIEPFIQDIVTNSFIIVGASGSGKTFFLNNCLKKVYEGSKDRIILVEEFHELFPPNRHTICLDVPCVKPGEVPIFDYIVAQTNLMRAQHLMIGEIKGREAWPFVLNAASGTFSGCTIHGQSPEDGLTRLQMLMATAQMADRETCGDLISKAIKYVVYIDKHRVRAIKRLTGTFLRATNKFQLEEIFKG